MSHGDCPKATSKLNHDRAVILLIDFELQKICRKLYPVIGGRAVALWNSYLISGNSQLQQETEALIRMFAARYLPSPISGNSILLNLPKTPLHRNGIFLGNILYDGRVRSQLYLTEENLRKHVGIFSITGSGKTNTAQLVALGLLRKHIPFLVVDWKRSYRSLKAHKEGGDVKVYSIGRMGDNRIDWNPLRPPPGIPIQTWISIVAETLESSHVAGQGVADVFVDLFDTLLERSGFYEKKTCEIPNFHEAKNELERTRYSGRRSLWRDSCLRILRTFTFGPSAESFNSKKPVKIEELLRQSVIIEMDQELPKPLRIFFNQLIIRWVHLHRLSQGETDALRHVLILEEVHNIFQKQSFDRSSADNLEVLVREIRSFGEGLVFITQHPSLLPIHILGNSNTLIFLNLQHEDDVNAARKSLFLSHEESMYLGQLQVGEGIVKIAGQMQPCHVKFKQVDLGTTNMANDHQ